MAKKGIIDVKLHVGPGDFERNEVQVYIYLPLTIPKSRCRIRTGGSEGKHVEAPLGYFIKSKDVLEYMTRNEDLAYPLMKLMEADVLRDIRRGEKLSDKTDGEILELLLKRKEELETKEKEQTDRVKSFANLPNLADVVVKIKEFIEGES